MRTVSRSRRVLFTPLALAALLLLGGLTGCTGPGSTGHAGQQRPVTAGVAPESLVGRWRIDLRPTPDAEPYEQELVVDSVAGGRFTGTFYGSPVREARLNGDWGALRFSFVTEDGSGPYLHAGVLRDGRLEGMSNATGRDFLMVWRGRRAGGP
ncbi:MAG: hypothetical protein RIE32_01840 [Phycisphaerales bacterium]